MSIWSYCCKGKQSAVSPAVAGISVQAVAASGPAAPEPGQSRPADCASFSLPCLTGIGREGGKGIHAASPDYLLTY